MNEIMKYRYPFSFTSLPRFFAAPRNERPGENGIRLAAIEYISFNDERQLTVPDWKWRWTRTSRERDGRKTETSRGEIRNTGQVYSI